MDFIESDHPVDNLRSVWCVLSFVSQSISQLGEGRDLVLDSDDQLGLCAILAACKDTVEQATKDIQRP